MSTLILEAKVVSVGGLAEHLPHATKGMLGISISNHFFSNDHVVGIVRLGLRLCDDFSIVLFDYPERWNWPLKRGITPAQNEQHCLMIGQEKKAGFTRELKKYGLAEKVSILTWADIMDHPAYQRNVTVIYDEFEKNTAFRTAVLRQLQVNLGSRLEKNPLSETELLVLSNYLLEEIAGLFYLQFDLGYQFDLYPKPQMEVIQRIYNNEFLTISTALPYDWSQQGWVAIGFDD